jgi:hypothetical protein
MTLCTCVLYNYYYVTFNANIIHMIQLIHSMKHDVHHTYVHDNMYLLK